MEQINKDTVPALALIGEKKTKKKNKSWLKDALYVVVNQQILEGDEFVEVMFRLVGEAIIRSWIIYV